MPTEVPTKPKPKRATWRDWAPGAPESGALLTREELLERLEAAGVPVTGNQLRYWQTAGLVPYPIRHRRGQGVYAYWPPWMVELIRSLRDQQARNRKHPEIQARLRSSAASFAAGVRYDNVLIGGFPPELERRLIAIADEWGALIGERVRYVEVSLVTDTSGGPLVWATPIPDPDRAAS